MSDESANGTHSTNSDPAKREFSRFEELTRRLVRVPKSEIDAERAKTNGAKRDR